MQNWVSVPVLDWMNPVTEPAHPDPFPPPDAPEPWPPTCTAIWEARPVLPREIARLLTVLGEKEREKKKGQPTDTYQAAIMGSSGRSREIDDPYGMSRT